MHSTLYSHILLTALTLVGLAGCVASADVESESPKVALAGTEDDLYPASFEDARALLRVSPETPISATYVSFPAARLCVYSNLELPTTAERLAFRDEYARALPEALAHAEALFIREVRASYQPPAPLGQKLPIETVSFGVRELRANDHNHYVVETLRDVCPIVPTPSRPSRLLSAGRPGPLQGDASKTRMMILTLALLPVAPARGR